MKHSLTLLTALLLAPLTSIRAAELTLTAPLDYQVVQRSTPAKGLVRIAGELSEEVAGADVSVEARLVGEKQESAWLRVGGSVSGRKVSGTVEAPAGGWWKLEVRVSQGGKQLALGSVAHVGIGEVFVVAGQSNSANHGEEKQTTKTRRVASFDGKAWRIADDPQPGASGGGGSFVPPFADAVAEKENVLVGILACGIGATSVREWLPKGATFPNPPTLMGRVEQLADGQWASKGAAYEAFVARMKSVGPQGFRAVLWHQGESDANQKDATRTLPGRLYREHLEKIIRESRRAIGWEAPWFVAQASYHVPGDEGSDDIRAAQASLWKDGIALEGPDSDALKGKLRERDGKGVHFSGEGLRVHGAKWAEKVIPWLGQQPSAPSSAKSAASEFRLAAPFAEHMVLQREQRVPVWGWSAAGDVVTVQFAAQSKSGVADASGKWAVMLDAMKANSEPQTMTVSSRSGARVEIGDVLIGEVWLCAGQSNMAMTVDGQTKWLHVGGIADAKEVVRGSANPLLRQFSVEWKTDTRPQDDCKGSWSIAGPDATANFSATGYFFARELQQRLKVPVGVINASFGGSSVEGWTSREALERESDSEFVGKMNQLIHDYDHHEQLVAAYVSALSAWEKKYNREDPNGDSDDNEYMSTAEGKKVTLPASLAKLGCPDGGVVWLRRDIEVPAEFGNAWRFDFPACRAFYSVFLNGTKVFDASPTNDNARRSTRPTPPRTLTKPGKNTLVVKLHSQSGASGITSGPFSIVPFNGKLAAVPLAGDWLCKVEKTFAPLPKNAAPMPVAPVKGTLHWMPVPSQYNAMLHPLIPYAMRGVAWYQGESNVGNARYAQHLKILVNDWRRRWGSGDFPFYSCQLAGFGPRSIKPTDSPWAECRERQTAVLDLPNTGLVNLIDTCEDGDLHPLNKQDPGKRLALVALANTYGFKDLAWSGPVFDSMKIAGGKAILTFKHIGGGLVAKPLPATYHPNQRKPELAAKPLELPSPGSELQGFILCDASQKWVNAQARIEGEKVIVWSPEVPSPVAVRYAWANHPVCNLSNQAGLPAFAFRTDDWPAPNVEK
jgi:sialate O-acetylesterase